MAGRPDHLEGYCLTALSITDPGVIATSGSAVHTMAKRTGNTEDAISGVVLLVSQAELEAADRYEVADVERIEVILRSGTKAFAYVGVDC